MSSAVRQELLRFAKLLRDLRDDAGIPPLRQFERLTQDLDRVLPHSTVAEKLNGQSLPDWDFVVSFVKACERYATERDKPLDDDRTDQSKWDAAHRKLLHALDLARADQTLSRAARRQLGGSAGHSGSLDSAPRQLPSPARHFTGRDEELKATTGSVHRRQNAAGSAIAAGSAVAAISAIDGMAGVGKTALAVHAAHRLADQFPDGQIFLDLHGFSTGIARVEPADALDRLLRTMGVSAERIPAGLEERSALWRSVLAGRRMLIVLDNVANEAQVQPLLPGEAGCLALVTSRRRLIALEATTVLSLDTLPQADAALLFVRAAERPELDAVSSDVLEAVTLCGRLPLAIRIAAARLKHSRAWTVNDLVQRLRDEDARLSALDDGHRSVHAALHLSYQHLPPDAQRLYCLLGLHPGRDIDASAAAALTAGALEATRRLLDRLVDDHLLQEPRPGRYRSHDLVRAHASGLAKLDPAGDTRDAVDRLLDYYQHAAWRADSILATYTRPASSPTARPPIMPDLPDWDRTRTWLRAERDNLLAALALATARHQHHRVVTLTAGLSFVLQNEGPYGQAVDLHRAAIAAAARTGDRLHQADAMLDLATIHRLLGEYPEMERLSRNALELYQALGNRLGQANALLQLAILHYTADDYPGAAQALAEVLAFYRDLGDRRGEAGCLTFLAAVHYLTGRAREAIGMLEDALASYRTLGAHLGEANVLNELGLIRYAGGDYRGAAADIEAALEVSRRIDYRLGKANALNYLAILWCEQERYAEASEALSEALATFRDLGNRTGQANTHYQLAVAKRLTGDLAGAAESLDTAHRLYTGLGDRVGQANATSELGLVRSAQGLYPQAVVALTHSIEQYRAVSDQRGEAEALNSLGSVHRTHRQAGQALDLYKEALELAQRFGHQREQACALEGIGWSNLDLGQPSAAHDNLRKALDIYQRLGAAQASYVQSALAQLE